MALLRSPRALFWKPNGAILETANAVLEPRGAVLELKGTVRESQGAVLEPKSVEEPRGAVLEPKSASLNAEGVTFLSQKVPYGAWSAIMDSKGTALLPVGTKPERLGWCPNGWD